MNTSSTSPEVDPDAPAATVVIPVRNDAAGIEKCLRGLQGQRADLETIVVDDGSTDGTAEVARRFGALVLSSGGRGAAAARNLGVLSARSDVILFTDGDCIPRPGWARALIDTVSESRVVAAKGVYRSRQDSTTARFVQLEYEERYDRMRRYPEIDFLDTYCLAVRRSEFLAIGGFDESFEGASVEDQEMSFRLHGRGRFLFVPRAVVEHTHAASPKVYLRKKLRIGRGKATVVRLHRDRIQGDSHTPLGLVLQVPAVCAAAIALLGSAVLPTLFVPALLLSLSPIGLSAPLLVRVGKAEGVAFLGRAAGLVLARGWALGIGFVWGLVSPLARLGALLEDGTSQSQAPPEEPARRSAPVEYKRQELTRPSAVNQPPLVGPLGAGPQTKETIEAAIDNALASSDLDGLATSGGVETEDRVLDSAG